MVWAFTALFLPSGLSVFAADEITKPNSKDFWQMMPNLDLEVYQPKYLEGSLEWSMLHPGEPLSREGSLLNPYQITTAKELASLAWRVNVKGETLEGLFYEINPFEESINLTAYNWVKIGVSVTGIHPLTGLPETKSKPFLGHLMLAKDKTVIGVWHNGSDAAETVASDADMNILADKIETLSAEYGKKQESGSILSYGTDFTVRGTGANCVIVLNTAKALAHLADQINHYDGESYYGGAFNIPNKIFDEGSQPFNVTNANYELSTNFNADFGNMYFTPIGTAANPFNGTFDGRAQHLRNLVLYSEATTGYKANGDKFSSDMVWKYYQNMGLFGVTENATVQNLQISNIRVIVSELSLERKVLINNSIEAGQPYAITNSTSSLTAGSLIGYAKNTDISNCIAEGEVVVYTNALPSVGGLVGRNEGSRIQNCITNAKVSLMKTGMIGISNIGGFAGTTANGIIRNVYTQGTISANNLTSGSAAQINLGGIVGFVSGGSGRIFSTLSLINILGEPSAQKCMGGIVGKIEPGLYPNTPAINNFHAGYYKRLNDFSTGITNAVGNSSEFVIPSGNLMRMLTSSDPYDTENFYTDNNKWASGDAQRASWDFNETWKFDNAKRLPILQIFGQYTFYLYNGSEIYQMVFIDPAFDQMNSDTGNKKIKDDDGKVIIITDDMGRMFEANPETETYRTNAEGNRIPVSNLKAYSGDRVIIQAEFKNVPEESTPSSPVSYGKYYLFLRFIHGDNDVYGVQGTNSISYSFDCTSARSGLYSASIQTKIIEIRVDIEDDSGLPNRAQRNHGYYTSGAETQSYDSENTFLISYGNINTFKAFPKNDSPYSYSVWEVRDFNWASLSTPETIDQNPLRVGIGTGTSSGATRDFAQYVIQGDGENGRRIDRLYLYLTANFTSKNQQMTLKAQGKGGHYSIQFFDNTSVSPSNTVDQNNSLIFNAANAVPLRKKFRLQATVQNGYKISWSIRIGNNEEPLPISNSCDIQFVDSITSLYQVKDDVLYIRNNAANITITVTFEIDENYISFELFGTNGWYIVAPAIGLVCAAIPPIVIVMVRKRRYKKKRIKQIEK